LGDYISPTTYYGNQKQPLNSGDSGEDSLAKTPAAMSFAQIKMSIISQQKLVGGFNPSEKH